MTVKFGLIGCGRIADRHLKTLSLCQDAELVAVSDVVFERMEAAENNYAQYKGEKIKLKKYSDYVQLLLEQEIDAIIITTISARHADMAKQALVLNKHVILEKPMALSIKEANEIITLSQQRKLHVLVCHQLRYRPVMQKIKKLIDDGSLGSVILGVTSMRLYRTKEYYRAAPWRGTWQEDGGMLINQGIHMVDLLLWFIGEVIQVYGDIERVSSEKETEDVALGMLTFKNKARGMIEANTVTYPDNLEYSLTIFAEKGCISLGGKFLDRVYRWEVEGYSVDQREIRELIKNNDEHLLMYQDFVQTLTSKKESLLVDAKEGIRSLETIFSLYESAVKHRPVNLPLTSFSTTNMRTDTGW